MAQPIKRIAITGGAGQISYSLLYRIGAGDLLGPQQPIALHILEVPQMVEALKGVLMELEDCAFPLLHEIKIGSDPYELFAGCDYVLLLGAKPRGPGMERKDLLLENGKVFIEQGKALNKVAPKALVLVVGNPCNTNCLILQKNAPQMLPSQFFAMTMLDQNRAAMMLAKKAAVTVDQISDVTIWGNHSSTQVPDILNARISGRPALEVVRDREWMEKEFVSAVQKRGSVVIAARGKSSAGSAANAALQAMRSLLLPTPEGEWFSMALLSDGNPYGIKPGLVFSFPCVSRGEGKVEIVAGLKWDNFLKERIELSQEELILERRLAGYE